MIRYQITDGTHIEPQADLVQIRPGNLSAVRQAMQMHPRVLVNDRLDIALALQAGGVHLKSKSLRPVRLRSILPAGFIISVACHSFEDILNAEGADYALLSPIFDPLSKPALLPALGLGYLKRACESTRLPIIALGGMNEQRARQCREAGAAGFAGVSIFRG